MINVKKLIKRMNQNWHKVLMLINLSQINILLAVWLNMNKALLLSILESNKMEIKYNILLIKAPLEAVIILIIQRNLIIHFLFGPS